MACAYCDEPGFRDALKDQADYLRSHPAPCGAIQEAGSNLGVSLEGADLGLTHDSNDTIKDDIASFATEVGGTYLLYGKGQRPQKAWDDYWNQTAVPRFSYVGLP